MLLYGSTRTGKTTVSMEYTDIHHEHKKGNNIIVPVLYVECPATITIKSIIVNMIEALKSPYSISNVGILLLRLKKMLIAAKTEMIIIDEIHNLLDGGTNYQLSLNFIKHLSNRLNIPIVLVGTEKAKTILSVDKQVKLRFTPFELKPFKPDEEYIRMLLTIESIFPLRNASNLANPETAKLIMDLSEGLMGEMIDLLKDAATVAIRNKSEKISPDLIKKAYKRPS
jgi:Cdc6-like AAA superfamily ATPase